MNIHDRTISLIGNENFKKIQKIKVLIVGIGGVGGYVTEILARSGFKDFILVDGDKVEKSNFNRQIIAIEKTLGKYKVEAMRERINSISQDIEVKTFNIRFNEDTKDTILDNDFDIVIDCIDSLKDKVTLIQEVKKRDKYIVSAMGAGNRYKVGEYKIVDIFKTENDPLAKELRKLLRKNNIDNLDVCFTSNSIDVKNNPPSSMAHNPALCGITIAGYIINYVIGKK